MFGKAEKFTVDHAVLVATILTGIIAIVLLGSLSRCDRDRDAAKTVQADVGAQVATTQIHEAAAVGAATEEARDQITHIQSRTRRAVDRVRAAAPAPAVGPSPVYGVDPVERAFFDGVCSSTFYVASPACRGDGGGPESTRTAARP
jgi:hypothetical protein